MAKILIRFESLTSDDYRIDYRNVEQVIFQLNEVKF